jgi:hypothetical protein
MTQFACRDAPSPARLSALRVAASITLTPNRLAELVKLGLDVEAHAKEDLSTSEGS